MLEIEVNCHYRNCGAEHTMIGLLKQASIVVSERTAKTDCFALRNLLSTVEVTSASIG